MNISMHNASVGVYVQLLKNLDTILDKAEKWVAERKLDPNAILQSRLAPDMFTFTRQVQIAWQARSHPASKTTKPASPSSEPALQRPSQFSRACQLQASKARRAAPSR